MLTLGVAAGVAQLAPDDPSLLHGCWVALVDAVTGKEQLLTSNSTFLYPLGELASGSKAVFILKEIVMTKPGSIASVSASPGSGA